MEVKLNGFILSSILYDQFNASSDTEGFLIGETLRMCSAVIDDFSSDAKEQTLIYVVKNKVSCWGLGSWYNNTCDLDIGEINKALGNQKDQVIGWFKTRKHTSQVASFKERTLHCHLQTLFDKLQPLSTNSNITDKLIDSSHPNIPSQTSTKPSSKLPFLFLLHTTNNPNSNPLSSFNFHFSTMDAGGELKAVEMKVNNLSLTSPVEYRQGDAALTSNVHVLSMLTNSDCFFRDRSDVDKMIEISSGLGAQISKMEVAWMESEAELDAEFKELLELRRQVQKAEEEAQEKEELIASQEKALKEQNTTKDLQKVTLTTPIKPSIAKTSLTTPKTILTTPKTILTTPKTILTTPKTNLTTPKTKMNLTNTLEQTTPQIKVIDQTTTPQLPPTILPTNPTPSHTKTYQLITFEDEEDLNYNITVDECSETNNASNL